MRAAFSGVRDRRAKAERPLRLRNGPAQFDTHRDRAYFSTAGAFRPRGNRERRARESLCKRERGCEKTRDHDSALSKRSMSARSL